MVNADAAALLGRLGEACASVRAASTIEGVLDAVAEEARLLSTPPATHAWAAAMDGPTIRALRARSADRMPAQDLSPALLTSSLARLSRETPVVRDEGVVVTALLGTTGSREGLVIVSAGALDADAVFDLSLVHLATVAGLALEAAQLRQRVDTISEGRERLLATVAHDLRNPLNTFTMSADLIRDDLERKQVDTTRALSLVARMDRATARMQGLIEDLVEAGHVDAKDIQITLREEPAAELVRVAAKTAASALAEKRVSVTCEGSVDEEARVMADRARTLQLLSKLVAFASKSTGEGGAIRFGIAREGAHVIITAEAFGTSGAPVAPPEEGRGGLPLHLARGLAEAQHGALRIGGGEAFVVTLTLPAVGG